VAKSAWYRITFYLVGLPALLISTTLPMWAQGGLVSIVIVRHPETDTSQSDKPVVPLSEVGRERAALLAHTLKDNKFTHMFASHTTRSRDAIAELAAIHNLAIVQLPQPSSMIDGNLGRLSRPR
jgi:broad specificity phosphatase PhoE